MQKAAFLTEMLNDVKPGEIIGRGDIFEELYQTCRSAHVKVKKFISDDEDPDNMDKLLQLNEALSNVIEQYDQVKGGNLVKVAVPDISEESNGQGRQGSIQQASSPQQQKRESSSNLLDLDDSPSGSPTATTPKTTGKEMSNNYSAGNLMDDLMNLNFSDITPPPSWGAAGCINLGQSDSSSSGSKAGLASSSSNGGAPSYNMFASPVASVNPVSVESSSSTSSLKPVLATASPVQAMSSPMDDFEFVSNTGASPQENGISNEKQFNSDRVYKVKAYFSNHQNSPLTALTFRVAVPKKLQLKLDPQSAQAVPPFSKQAVTQEMTIWAPVETAVVRMRYHVSYVIGGRVIEEQGEFSQFP
ncbi:hypothetical protein BGZ54_006990 [Gamsiella multidivaricata]|nr:hypothetical protein BGZ54_006990 [Gamsiella multidivaricata]